MSYTMSSPAGPPPPGKQPYTGWQPSPSAAQSPYALPPAKRQRLSPDSRSSPNGSPIYPSHGPPRPGYGNPYAQQPVQAPYSPSSPAGSPTNSFNTPQPYQHQQMPWPGHAPPQQRPSQFSPPPPTSSREMPPPPRPNKQDDRDEKSNNIDDMGDSLVMAGISLKDEENYLNNMYHNQHGSDSFATNQSTSFGSSTLSPGNSFNALTQGTSFASQNTVGALAGTMGAARSQEQVEREAQRQRELQARRLAENHQHHLNNQFLQGNCLRNRMHRLGTENAVRLDVQGVYLRNPEPEARVMVNGTATEGIAAVKAKPESMIEAGVAYEHIVSLISIAAGERLRGLVEEAYGLARARQYGDHGRVVPPEFADIAEGQGQKSQESVIPESVTGTGWDKTQETSEQAQTNGEKGTPQPVQTVSFQGNLNASLREIANRDRKAEKERMKRRESRKRKAENAAGDENTPAETPADTPAASGPADAAAPISKMSKKELTKKAKEAASSEAQATTQANQTAAMMAMGGKTKKYSWMTNASAPVNRYQKPVGGSGTATPKAQAQPAAAVAAKEKEAKVPTWGDWREDSVDGKGIQLRDWVLVLERDGREKKALQKAVNKLQ